MALRANWNPSGSPAAISCTARLRSVKRPGPARKAVLRYGTAGFPNTRYSSSGKKGNRSCGAEAVISEFPKQRVDPRIVYRRTHGSSAQHLHHIHAILSASETDDVSGCTQQRIQNGRIV